MMLVPSMSSEKPNWSFKAGAGAVSSWLWVQLSPAPVKMATAPEAVTPPGSSPGTPTAMVFPSMAIESPKKSNCASSAKNNCCCWVQSVPVRVKT